jgi:aerobic-type carbon monoxide dehydrogenase small subunit (CoxS/CutS family)/carbon monoxide dehydrogenase subunit G
MDAAVSLLKAHEVTLSVNGGEHTLLVEPRMHLADALREQLNLTGTHLGCEQGVCGACTVLMDGVPQRSCIAYAVDCEGSRITTIEGFDTDETMAALREAFSVHHALQCGFCTPGMLITARDIVLRLGEVDEARIREELSGNLCRCTGYVGIVNAVRAVAAGRMPQTAASVVPGTPLVTRAALPPTSVEAHRAPTPVFSEPSGGTMLEEVVHLTVPPDVAWAALSDLRRVASCVPGMQLDSLDGDHVTGRVTLALGPIKASFSGEGRVSLDEASRMGRLRGSGRDGASRAEGEMDWTVAPGPQSGSDVTIRLWWRLMGPLAQFGRAALVQDLVRRVSQDFTRNLDASLAGKAPMPARAVGLFTMLWELLKSRLFGRETR